MALNVHKRQVFKYGRFKYLCGAGDVYQTEFHGKDDYTVKLSRTCGSCNTSHLITLHVRKNKFLPDDPGDLKAPAHVKRWLLPIVRQIIAQDLAFVKPSRRRK